MTALTALEKALAAIDAKFPLTPEQVERNEFNEKFRAAMFANDLDKMAELFSQKYSQSK